VPPFSPVPLGPADLDAAANVLVRAFADDPGLLFVLPDRAERVRLAPTLARAMIRFVARCGAPLVTRGTVRGVALWFPPDAADATSDDFAVTGMADMPRFIGPEALARFNRLANRLDDLHPQLAPEPHWYLTMLGVDPGWQRQGIGEVLMQPIFQAADHDGLCCYLEAPTAENARYYSRRGFQVVAETDIPDSTVHIWHMRREPRG
jgi:ribosomal protein S18 acetylase RimI-like enzyme